MSEKRFRNYGCNGDSSAQNNVLLAIETSINTTSIEIFRLHGLKLIQKPISYIIPAVWGFKDGGQVDPDQKAIYSLTRPLMQEIHELLQLEKLHQRQSLALEYMVRGLIIMKIMYMIECYNARKQTKISDVGHIRGKALDYLEDVEPIGRA